MSAIDDLVLSVSAHWKDWRSANARTSDLCDVHWHRPTDAPRSMIHAYLSCADVISGDLSHDCDPSSAPHHIRVCVLRSHNVPSVYAELARRADEARISCCQSPSASCLDTVTPAATGGWS